MVLIRWHWRVVFWPQKVFSCNLNSLHFNRDDFTTFLRHSLYCIFKNPKFCTHRHVQVTFDTNNRSLVRNVSLSGAGGSSDCRDNCYVCISLTKNVQLHRDYKPLLKNRLWHPYNTQFHSFYPSSSWQHVGHEMWLSHCKKTLGTICYWDCSWQLWSFLVMVLRKEQRCGHVIMIKGFDTV